MARIQCKSCRGESYSDGAVLHCSVCYKNLQAELDKVIEINGKIQVAVLAGTLGVGGDKMLRENLAALDKLCQEVKNKGGAKCQRK